MLEHPNLYSDPVTLENTNSRDSVFQQNTGKNFPRRHNNVSDCISVEQFSYLCQKKVNAPKIDTRVCADAPIRYDDTLNPRQDPFIRHDTDSTAFADLINPVGKTDEPTKIAIFQRTSKYNLRPDPKLNFPD